MSGYVKLFDETKYISFLIKDNELENTMKSGIKLIMSSKKDLTANKYTMKKN